LYVNCKVKTYYIIMFVKRTTIFIFILPYYIFTNIVKYLLTVYKKIVNKMPYNLTCHAYVSLYSIHCLVSMYESSCVVMACVIL